MLNMYPGIPFSPQTALSDSIGAADTIIKVADITVFPDAPNYATIGTDKEGETILYAAKTTDSLSGCTRGVEGIARSWPVGSPIGRNFTNRDFEALQSNIKENTTAVENAKIIAENTRSTVDTFSRSNLLDNWYFGNPVNQRGQTSYTAGGYTIDRWTCEASTGISVSVEDGFLRIQQLNATSAAKSQTIRQVMDNKEAFFGKVMTYSILYRGTGVPRLYAADGVNAFATQDVPVSDGWSLATMTFTVPDNVALNFSIRIYADISGSNGYLDIMAAKLELGDTQTLARQDADGNWVLNEIPDYGEQLAKCQRYFVEFTNDVGIAIPIGFGSAFSTTGMFFTIPLPVTMRAIPAIGITGNIRFRGNGADVDLMPSEVSWIPFAVNPNGVSFRGVTPAYFVDKEFYNVLTLLGTKISITADL